MDFFPSNLGAKWGRKNNLIFNSLGIKPIKKILQSKNRKLPLQCLASITFPHHLINHISTLSPITNQLGAWGNLSFNRFVQLSMKRKLVKPCQVSTSLHINIYCDSPTFNCIQICNWNCPHNILPHAHHSWVISLVHQRKQSLAHS